MTAKRRWKQPRLGLGLLVAGLAGCTGINPWPPSVSDNLAHSRTATRPDAPLARQSALPRPSWTETVTFQADGDLIGSKFGGMTPLDRPLKPPAADPGGGPPLPSADGSRSSVTLKAGTSLGGNAHRGAQLVSDNSGGVMSPAGMTLAFGGTTPRPTPDVRFEGQTGRLPDTSESQVAVTTYQKPATVSDATRTAKPTSDHLPTPAAVVPLTLDQIIQTTLWADPRLRAGFESIPQAQADALTAALWPNPQLNISQTLMPLTRPFTVTEQGGPPQFDVGIRYPIDWFLFGKRAAALQSATWGVRVAEAEFADLVRQRVLDAILRYYDLLEAKALVELAQQDVDNLRRIEAITAKAVEGGGRPRVELQRIQLDRLRAEQALRDAEKNRIVAVAQLRALLGRTDADPAFDVAGSILDVAIPAIPSAEEAFAVAAEERPDLQALRLRVQEAEANRLVEQRKAWPAVTPFLGYTRQFQRKAIGMPDASSFGFGMEADVPLFDRNQGNRIKSASVAAQSRQLLQAGLVELRAEIEQAVQEVRTAAANAQTIAAEQLKLAAEVRDSIAKAYEAGGRPLIDVLDAQRNFRETYRLYITSRATLGRAIARFNAAVNRRWLP
ncbi:MAG: TolC family protein [Gemmataceae bacterium]|nr:TolC family protein [Gemmataceae bacterium]